MNLEPEPSSVAAVFRSTAASLGRDIVGRRWLVLVSLVAAIVIWALIEDVENPRVEAIVPGETYQPIPVTTVNLPDGLIVRESLSVRVRVRAREEDIPRLTADSFRATVDAKGLAAGATVSRPVQVESKSSNVEVIAVQPPNVLLTPETAATRELPVTVQLSGNLPAGYQLVPGSVPVAEPALVKVTGRSELVDSVGIVVLEVNLTVLRDTGTPTEGDLIARTVSGNRVDVTVTPARARATVRVEQTFAQRSIPVIPNIAGIPAPGYRVVSISVDPAVVVANGPKDIVDGLTSLKLERVDLTGAKADVNQVKQIERPANVVTDRQTVVVKVEIQPYACGTQASSPCGTASLIVGPSLTEVPAGLRPAGPVSAEVRLAGPLPSLAQVGPADVLVTVSLAGATVGPGIYQPTATVAATAPPGITISSVGAVTINLAAVATP